jgi:endonuclease YncB( thermonuclease family)
MDPYVYPVREILRVVDADTVDCTITLGFGITASFRFRLFGVDAPEVYGPNASQAGRDAAVFAQQWLGEHAEQLVVRTYKGAAGTVGIGDGAFGRWLGLFADPATGDTLQGALVAAGHATWSRP